MGKRVTALQDKLNNYGIKNVGVDYNTAYTNKITLCFEGTNRWNCKGSIGFTSIKEAENFIENFIRMDMFLINN